MARKRRRKSNSDKALMAYMNRSIGRRLRLRKKKPRNKKYAYKYGRYLKKGKRKTKGTRRRKSSGGKRRGPKKGYKQTAQHIKRRIASRRKGAGWKKRRSSRRKRA